MIRAILHIFIGWTILGPITGQNTCSKDASGRQDQSCIAHDQAAIGHGLLQQAHTAKKTMDVKEHLFSEDTIDSSEGLEQEVEQELEDEEGEALKSNMKIIHGIPVYGYHSALHADSEDDVELLATEDDPVNWLVAWPDNTTDAEVDDFCKNLAGTAKCTMTGHPDENGLAMDTVRATKSELDDILEKHPHVSFAEADSTVKLIPEIPEKENALVESQTGLPWGLDRIDERTRDSQSSYTPSPKGGSGVHVYVLDTGVRTTHSQFEGRAIPTLESYYNVRKTCGPTDTKCAADGHGHGTHCAGTVAGKDYGVAPKATIHAVAVLSPRGSGSTSGIIYAIDWVLSKGPKPAVISMSLGGSRGSGNSYQVAIDKATKGGITVVVAAGNENTDACRKQPAYVPSAVTVGSTTSSDSRSGFSNYGTCVDIFAPGSSVKSAGHRTDTASATMSGTSMACPHVAGAAALILGQNPTLSAYNVTSNLILKATSKVIRGIPSSPASPNKLLYVAEILRKKKESQLSNLIK